jgi:inhibitor of cysteine peptidase
MPSFTLHEADNGKTIEVPLNSEVIIQLKENPTTGYKWSSPRFDGKLLLLKTNEFRAGEKKLIGGAGIRHFAFEAKGPGKTVVEMEYMRPWEAAATAAATFRVSIEIKTP